MNVFEFTCREEDEAMDIQLEPEAFCYTVEPGNTIQFVAVNATSEFSWTFTDHGREGIQLFPDPPGSYDDIAIYMNGEPIENIAMS